MRVLSSLVYSLHARENRIRWGQAPEVCEKNTNNVTIKPYKTNTYGSDMFLYKKD